MAKASPMFKVSQMAKDFGMKTKEVCTVIEESGISGKASSATMEPEEFNRFFDFITAENQIKNMDGYLNGQTVIKTPAAQAAALVSDLYGTGSYSMVSCR